MSREELIKAIRAKAVDTVRQLLKKDRSLANAMDDENNPVLCIAVQCSSGPVVEALLNCGARVDVRNNKGESPIVIAGERRDRACNPILDLLFETIQDWPTEGDLPSCIHEVLYAAAIYGKDQFLKILFRNAQDKVALDLNVQDADGNTALHMAIRGGRTQVVRTLLESRADPNIPNSAGDTPLHVAVGIKRNCLNIVSALIKKGANVGLRNKKGETPLYAAIAYCTGRSGETNRALVDIVKILLRQKTVIVDAQAEEGTTAIEIATKKGFLDVVRLLYFAYEDHGIAIPIGALHKVKNLEIDHFLESPSKRNRAERSVKTPKQLTPCPASPDLNDDSSQSLSPPQSSSPEMSETVAPPPPIVIVDVPPSGTGMIEPHDDVASKSEAESESESEKSESDSSSKKRKTSSSYSSQSSRVLPPRKKREQPVFVEQPSDAPTGSIERRGPTSASSPVTCAASGERKFKPRISLQELSTVPCGFFKRGHPESQAASSAPKPAGTDYLSVDKSHKLSKEAKDEIGKWGETYVYYELLTNYQEKCKPGGKYSGYELTLQKQGFKLTGPHRHSIEVIWHNKGDNKVEESRGPRDFTVIKCRGEKHKEYCIEVKTTTAAVLHKAKFSKGECREMRASDEASGMRYRIFRVYHAESENPSYCKIKDPWQTMLRGTTEVSSMSLIL